MEKIRIRIPDMQHCFSGFLTPEDALTALLPKEAVMGREPVQEPNTWQRPRATISWDASIFFVPAISQLKGGFREQGRGTVKQKNMFSNLGFIRKFIFRDDKTLLSHARYCDFSQRGNKIFKNVAKT
jgi:hypothetical protein